MTIDRFSRKKVLGGGAAALIAPLLHARSMTRQVHLTSLMAEGTDRVAGVSSEADYRAPGGLQSPYDNFITVAKDGGDYTSIRDAIDACHDPSAENTYCVFVYPGVYDEQIEMVNYVSLVGLDRDVCVIRSADYNTLVYMASNSSLNEIQVDNQYHDAPQTILIHECDDVLVDSCIIKVGGSEGAIAICVYTYESTNWRVLGSEIIGESTAGMSWSGVYTDGSASDNDGEIRYTKLLGPPGVHNHAFDVVGDGNEVYHTTIRILHCWVQLTNADITCFGRGLYVTYPATVYVEHTSFSHLIPANDVDIYVLWGGVVYVRANRYSTWFIDATSRIYSLMGDRPVKSCLDDDTDFALTAGAGVYQNDVPGVLTIDVPCRSDVSVAVAIAWASDVARATSFGAQVLADGVLAGFMSYASESVANYWQNYVMVVCYNDLDAGVHTIQLQVRRFNAGDAVTVSKRQIVVTSFPTP